MLDVILDTLLDTLKLIPFLFVAFLLLEYIEHRLSNSSKTKLEKHKNIGPVLGSILGAIPQCGFGTMATNMYAARVITLGTLISIYLSTSDEMIPIMLSSNVDVLLLLRIIAIKIAIGMFCGFIIDLIYRKKKEEHIIEFCNDEHCHCEDGLFVSSVKHTLNIALFVLIVTFILNMTIHYLGEDKLSTLIINNKFIGPIISSLIGLIPNCGASVILTELYLNNALTLGSLIGGLLTGSGVALLLLFKVNKNMKENLNIVLLLYLIGVISGIIINVIL